MEFFCRKLFKNPMRPLILICTILAVQGCASQDVATSQVCPAGLTYSCTSAVGQTQRCICASRDELRDIMNPVNDY